MFPLPFEFWEDEKRRLAAVIRPRLLALSIAGANEAVNRASGLGLYMDDTLIHADAAAWARLHTDELISQLTETTIRGVGEVVTSWIETPGATVGQLEQSLLPILDGNTTRASRIAITETTRAYAEGNNIVNQRAGTGRALYLPPAHPHCYCSVHLRRVKGQWVQVWYTNRDEKVCKQPLQTPWGIMEGCRAMQGVIVSEGELAGERA